MASSSKPSLQTRQSKRYLPASDQHKRKSQDQLSMQLSTNNQRFKSTNRHSVNASTRAGNMQSAKVVELSDVHEGQVDKMLQG